MRTKGITLKSKGANGYLAKTRIFNVAHLVVLQRLVLVDIDDTEYFEDYEVVKYFKDKKLLKQEMVFYKKSFDALIGAFLEI